jgi:hypothetical protein
MAFEKEENDNTESFVVESVSPEGLIIEKITALAFDQIPEPVVTPFTWDNVIGNWNLNGGYLGLNWEKFEEKFYKEEDGGYEGFFVESVLS